MSGCYFAIDKNESFSILNQIKNSTKICDKNIDEEDDYRYNQEAMLYEHKLILIDFGHLLNEDLLPKSNDKFNETIFNLCKESNKICWYFEESLEINEIYIDDDNSITFYGTTSLDYMDSSTTYYKFKYDNELQTWIYDMGYDNMVCKTTVFLSFNNYKTKPMVTYGSN